MAAWAASVAMAATGWLRHCDADDAVYITTFLVIFQQSVIGLFAAVSRFD